MRKSITIGLLLWGCSLMAAIPGFVNPILPYDYSDPDIIRVGDTYLMTSSSFNNVPGLQILTSKDLVHWRIENAAIRDRLPGYEPGDKVLGNFVWAPSIREHDGRLYIFYGDPDRGIYCIRGQLHAWEEPVLVMPGKGLIDPCPLWDDDGRVWLVHALAGSRAGLKSVLLMAELTSDALSVKTPSRIIFDGHAEHPTCEGPKLYKRNGYYYIMHPAGGVSTGWQVVQRSRNIYGPYEMKITLQQGHTAINGPHQGGWVETPEGESWFVHFQDVGVAGRIVHLQPVQWVNDWPEMGQKGEPILSYSPVVSIQPDKGPTWANFVRREEFDSTALALDWQWAGGYIDPKWYFCDAANSLLRLYSAAPNEELMPNMLLQKIPTTAFTATTRVRFVPCPDKKMQGAEKAGLIVFGRKIYTLEPSVTNEWTYLRLMMDDQQNGQFYTSTDGIQWTEAGEAFRAEKGYWTGTQVGLFCTRNKTINDAGWLDVDWFEIQTQSRAVPAIPEDSVRTLCEYMVTVYPKATLQDLYKTCYQDFFGAEHMISDTASVRAYLHQEYMQALELSKKINTSSLPNIEFTGFRHRCMRMYLYYDWSMMDIPEDVIFQSFLQAGKLGPVHDNWYGEWCQIEQIALQFHPEWRNEELQNLLRQAASNNQAVHHSDAFREAYHPHYRIVKNE